MCMNLYISLYIYIYTHIGAIAGMLVVVAVVVFMAMIVIYSNHTHNRCIHAAHTSLFVSYAMHIQLHADTLCHTGSSCIDS